MPWTANSQASKTSSAASKRAFSGWACSQTKARAIALTARSRRIGRRWRSESSAWRLGSSGVVPSGCASTPSGRSCPSASWRTFAGLTPRPVCSETTAATCSASRRPSHAAATACSSGVSLIICPSPRRASSGGSRNPESSYSPSSSTPSASTRASRVRIAAAGDAATGETATSPYRSAEIGVLRELRVDHVGVLRRIVLEHELAVEDLLDAGLLGLDRLVELVDRRVLRLELAQRLPDVGELAAAGARDAHRGLDDAHELARLGHDLAAGALEVERDRLVGRRDPARGARDEHDLERDRGRLAVRAACRRVGLVGLVDDAAALGGDVPGEVERPAAVLLDRRLREVLAGGRLRAAGRQRAGDDGQERGGAAAYAADHGAVSLCSMVD